MTIPLVVTRDQNSTPTWLPNLTPDTVGATIAAGVTQTYTVPANAYKMLITTSNVANIVVGVNVPGGTLTAPPTGPFIAKANQAALISGTSVVEGDVISILAVDDPALVYLHFYRN